MADWNQPTGASLYSAVLTDLKSRDESAIKMQEGTSESNLPSAAKRYNTSTNKFERWNGSAWSNLGFHAPIDSHIADTAIHFPPPVGSIFMWPTLSAPTGFLLCDGTAVSRAMYATLFALIGTTFGAGDGSTTFNLPNFKQRMPIGRDASQAACDTIGETGGTFNHQHSTPAHLHTIASHTHDMANHFHSQPTHVHAGPLHNHLTKAHYHSTEATGATIAINSSGTHSHTYGAKEGGSNGSGANRAQGASSGSGTNVAYNTDTSGSNHTHNHSQFTGTVGNQATGVLGDIDQVTTDSGTGNTSPSGGDNTNPPNTNVTGGSGILSTGIGEGSAVTGGQNQAYLTVNFIMKT